MRGAQTATRVFIWCIWIRNIAALSLPASSDHYTAPGEVVKNAPEPSCEELKAMWRLSKRQSRASELTNEIPRFQDPFANNIWQPYYATSRNMGRRRMDKSRSRPIYGRIVHKPPSLSVQDFVEKNVALEELAQNYGRRQVGEPRRRITSTRMAGLGNSKPIMAVGYPQHIGSFQHLKELIKTERARELHDQRIAEENAARMKIRDMSPYGKHKAEIYSEFYDIEQQQREPEQYINRLSVIHFPDLLAPSPHHGQMSNLLEEFSYQKSNPRTPNSLFGTSSFAYTDHDPFYI